MNKAQAVKDFIMNCPLVGYDMFFNFVDTTNENGNTSLLTSGYGSVVKKYVDGTALKRFECEIRQTKPLSRYANTDENVEQLQCVQEFLDWVNKQGKEKNFPDFGKECTVYSIGTPEGVCYPMQTGITDGTALYAFPFEILYTERM